MNGTTTQFLGPSIRYKVYHVLYDYLSFVLFLVFVLFCFVLGKLLYFVDKIMKTRLTDHLIRFFEFFAR